MNTVRHTIHSSPKADLHNHLHLSANLATIQTQYPEYDLNPPSRYNGLDGMIQFIETSVNPILRSSDDVVFFLESAIATSIADNVTYLEASVDMNLVRFFNGDIQALIETVALLVEKYSATLTFRPDIGINKELPLDIVYKYGHTCIESGVFMGVDLYGRELDTQLERFSKLYNYARQHALKTKVHIGEFSDSDSIERVIKVLNPDHIQHGIQAAYSKQTMDLILENEIRLNICPQSNLSLGAVNDLASHPIRILYDYGIPITINTDDYLLFNASVTDEYLMLYEGGIFTLEELNRIRVNSFPQ